MEHRRDIEVELLLALAVLANQTRDAVAPLTHAA
jgi:hypothetical protein